MQAAYHTVSDQTSVLAISFPSTTTHDTRQYDSRVFFIDMVKIARGRASELADLEMRIRGLFSVLLGAFLKLNPYATDSPA